MPSEHLAGSQKQALAGIVHGGVRRLLIDVKGFEVNPHGVGGIGHAAVSQRVGQQQVAELVMDRGFGNRQDGQERARRASASRPTESTARARRRARAANRRSHLSNQFAPELGCDVRQRDRDRSQADLDG